MSKFKANKPRAMYELNWRAPSSTAAHAAQAWIDWYMQAETELVRIAHNETKGS